MLKEFATSVQSPCRQGMCCPKSPTRHHLTSIHACILTMFESSALSQELPDIPAAWRPMLFNRALRISLNPTLMSSVLDNFARLLGVETQGLSGEHSVSCAASDMRKKITMEHITYETCLWTSWRMTIWGDCQCTPCHGWPEPTWHRGSAVHTTLTLALTGCWLPQDGRSGRVSKELVCKTYPDFMGKKDGNKQMY